jgi:hypothetical protein
MTKTDRDRHKKHHGGDIVSVFKDKLQREDTRFNDWFKKKNK